MQMEWRICRTLAVMQKDIARPLRLTTLAKQVNLSPSRFSHLFRKETGQSPARYLHDLRLDCALMLLYDSTMSIKEVMAAVGFNDPSHFTRDFCERHTVTPTEFRASAQGCNEQTIVNTWLSSRNSQQTAASANDPLRRSGQSPSIFDVGRDERAKGA
jgi:transcriptional regulator GlxA family with amidase domain